MSTYDRSFALTVAGSGCGLLALLVLVFFGTCSNPPAAEPEELVRRILERAMADQPWRLREWAYGRTTIATMRYDYESSQPQKASPGPQIRSVGKISKSTSRSNGSMKRHQTMGMDFQ